MEGAIFGEIRCPLTRLSDGGNYKHPEKGRTTKKKHAVTTVGRPLFPCMPRSSSTSSSSNTNTNERGQCVCGQTAVLHNLPTNTTRLLLSATVTQRGCVRGWNGGKELIFSMVPGPVHMRRDLAAWCLFVAAAFCERTGRKQKDDNRRNRNSRHESAHHPYVWRCVCCQSDV